MKIRALKEHKSANCRVVIDDNGSIEFISYNTPIIKIEENELIVTGTYSQTTRRQIGWFLAEYLPSLNYYDLKKLVNKKVKFDILKKEFKEFTKKDIAYIKNALSTFN